MNVTRLVFHSPLSANTSWAVFSGMDLSAYQSVEVIVTEVNVPTQGDTTLSTISAGYSAATSGIKDRTGNLQSSTTEATTEIFKNDGPLTDNESFSIASTNAGVFSAIVQLYS